MKISSLEIKNFRGISHLDTGPLGDTIVIAGQNGSGKSCIFDAIRLVKSVYGGYQQNEWQSFFNEFAIGLGGESHNLKGLFNRIDQPIEIVCRFQLRDREKSYIHTNAAELLQETIWQSILPEAFQFGGYRKALFAAQFRERQPEVDAHVQKQLPEFYRELALPQHVASVTVLASGESHLSDSHVLQVIFSTYRPRDIGVIDFHGAQRHYGRENVAGINLNLEQARQVRSQSALYNYNAKYSNVKSEMAGNYVAELLAEKAQGRVGETVISLSQTMKELFSSFFPDKEFLGPRPTPDGSLSFPVRTQNGVEHDLDELSSGEKEILYGYLRIRSSAPRDSIILLDEPELHLNPRLIRGLPEFYRKHLGEALENQLWLVTHSDALIREAVGKSGFNVYHMLPCGAEPSGSSQLKSLSVSADLDPVIADLVGDLAAYRPGGKAVIFEGGGDSDFDKNMTATLFSSDVRGMNLISGSNKARVKVLHEVLERAYEKGDLPTKFFAVVDRDSDGLTEAPLGVTAFTWDVYHIENYLLEPRFIAQVINNAQLGSSISESEVLARLENAARRIFPSILIRQIKDHANHILVGAINLSFDPATLTIGSSLRSAVERSAQKVTEALGNSLSRASLDGQEARIRETIESSFSDGSWIKTLPGRDMLKGLVAQQITPANYDSFRNQIVSAMALEGYQPHGMKAVIEKIRMS